jgi:hypothetical protein
VAPSAKTQSIRMALPWPAVETVPTCHFHCHSESQADSPTRPAESALDCVILVDDMHMDINGNFDRRLLSPAAEIASWIEDLCILFSRYSPFVCCNNMMKVPHANFVQPRVRCQDFSTCLHTSHFAALRILQALYHCPFQRNSCSLTLALTLVHKEFDVNTATLPSLQFTSNCNGILS